jgi:putative heme iron utilization protein
MTDTAPKDVLGAVDDEARSRARDMLRTARSASLGTLDAACGAPWVSRVAIATFVEGDVGFFISALAPHQRNLVADGRCSLLVGEPGKGDPLAHARLTLLGRAERLPDGPARDAFRARYRAHNAKSKLYEDLPDFSYWRFRAERVSLNAGFGRAYAPTPADLRVEETLTLGWGAAEPQVLACMNEEHGDAVDACAALAGGEGQGWRLVGLDPEGATLARGDEVRRLRLELPVASVGAIRARLLGLVGH